MLQLAVFLLLPFADAQDCDVANNDPVSELNYADCNNAGRCIGGRRSSCECCNKGNENNWCFNNPAANVVYIFTGDECTTVTYKYAVTFGWRFETPSGNPDIICEDAGLDIERGIGVPTNPSLQNQVNAAMNILGYNGLFYAAACQTCSPEKPCDFTNEGITEGMTAGFATELNTYYNPNCATFQFDNPVTCPENDDLGVAAYNAFIAARGDANSQNMAFTVMLNQLVSGNFAGCAQLPPGLCMAWQNSAATVYVQNDLDSQRENFLITTKPPTPDPTESPTDPTAQPTATPTIPRKCFKYVNRVMDHKFKGSADNCREGISDKWPGGKSCASPYVICLPEANTPANPDPTEIPNFGQSLPALDYSIDECAQECAFDQRCLGFELRPALGSTRGRCLLIDDIPISLTSPGSWPSGLSANKLASGIATVTHLGNGNCCSLSAPTPGLSLAQCEEQALGWMEGNYFSYSSIGAGLCSMCRSCAGLDGSDALWNSYQVTGRLELGNPDHFDMLGSDTRALCFAKEDYCNPHFEAEDLNQEMLDCYCPNNRKGTYTKKVKRTVPNTRYCGNDPSGDINVRIKTAQANRMFHLCENWCLFETGNPMTESWYWDPWRKCWREQYAGIGTHRSYCNRVIRDPMTIEQQFINKRSDNFCKKDPLTGQVLKDITEEPTMQPSTFGTSTWYLASEEDSCDDACKKNGDKKCDELKTNSPLSPTELSNAMKGAGGQDCTKVEQGKEGWALPAQYMDGTCLSRDPDTEYTGCNWAVGVGYKRLCACY